MKTEQQQYNVTCCYLCSTADKHRKNKCGIMNLIYFIAYIFFLFFVLCLCVCMSSWCTLSVLCVLFVPCRVSTKGSDRFFFVLRGRSFGSWRLPPFFFNSKCLSIFPFWLHQQTFTNSIQWNMKNRPTDRKTIATKDNTETLFFLFILFHSKLHRFFFPLPNQVNVNK